MPGSRTRPRPAAALGAPNAPIGEVCDPLISAQRRRPARRGTFDRRFSGYADKENAIRAINEAGLYYYLEKPWNNDHLKVIIRNGVERTSLFRELDVKVTALESAHGDLAGIRRRLIQAFI